jgi:cytosine/uracil/thiamine/allantoin permease
MSLLSIVLAIIIVFALIWAVQTLAGSFGIPDPIRGVILVLIVLVFIIWLVGALGGGHSLGQLRL